MTETQPPPTEPGAPGEIRVKMADDRVHYAWLGIALFGLVSFTLFGITLLDTGRVGLWGPGTTTLIAWILMGLHLAISGRYLSAFDPAVWVPVVMLFHYFGMPVAVELLAPRHFVNYDALGLGIEPPRLSQGFIMALLTMSSFLFGMYLAGWKRLGNAPPVSEKEEPAMARAAWCMLILSVAMTVIGIPIAGPDLVFGAYNDLKMAQKLATADLRFFFTGCLLSTTAVIAMLACHRRSRPWRSRAAIGSAAFLSVLLLLTGDRGGLSGLVFGSGWAYAQRVRRAPWTITVAGYLGALLIMPMIAEMREHKTVENTARLGPAELTGATFYEMGGSIAVFGYTLEHIPRDKPYDWGVSILSALVNNIPNLGLSPGRMFALDNLKHNPGQWVTYVANPNKWAINKGGYAYAIGAEWYFNFGMAGVILGMTLTGWVMGRLRNRSREGAMRLIVASSFYVLIIFAIRNSISFPLRAFLWPIALLWLMKVCLPRPRQPLEILGPRYPETSASA